jgi:hypothetical protein
MCASTGNGGTGFENPVLGNAFDDNPISRIQGTGAVFVKKNYREGNDNVNDR